MVEKIPEERLRFLELAFRALEENLRHIQIKLLPDLENRFNAILVKLLERLEKLESD